MTQLSSPTAALGTASCEFVRLACVLALSTDAVAALTKAQIGAVERPCGGTERLPRLWRCPPDDTASLTHHLGPCPEHEPGGCAVDRAGCSAERAVLSTADLGAVTIKSLAAR